MTACTVTTASSYQHTWPEHVTRTMADHIHAEVKAMVSSSRLVRKSDGISLVSRSELVVGEILGQGAFSEVHRVKVNRKSQGSDDSSGGASASGFYAMKHLKHKLMSQPDNFRLAASELAVEAHMLASFDHPNIIRIHGWAANGVASFTQGGHDSFFLLLDCLEETLEDRVKRWGEQEEVRKLADEQSSTNIVNDLWRRFSSQATHDPAAVEREHQRELRRQERQLLHLEKLGVCTEIASALSYLHERGVIFRDLKPNNIGFLHGRVKLFDFGLSRELPQYDLTQPFAMSGKCGTLRYMAVEVASHLPYNVSSDIYSWAMVCFEVMTLQKPFAGWTREMHASLVCGRGARPDARAVPACIRPLMEASWSQVPALRPSAQIVCQKMRVLEEQELLSIQAQQSHDEYLSSPSLVHPVSPYSISPRNDNNEGGTVVELPQDFTIFRKPPGRNHSTYTTSTTVSLSTSGNDSYYE